MMKLFISQELRKYQPFKTGLIILFFGLLLYFIPMLESPPRFDELEHVEGHILQNIYKVPSRSSSYFELRVRSHGEEVRLLATAVCTKIENLRSLGPGQKIEAFAIKDNLGRNFSRVWEIYREGQPIAIYEDFASNEADKNHRIILFSKAILAIGFLTTTISAIYFKTRNLKNLN